MGRWRHLPCGAGIGRLASNHQKGTDERDHPTTARIRQAGGRRKKSREHDPTRVRDLEAPVDPDTYGDPMSPLHWTCKSTCQLAQALYQQGHTVSERVVRILLHEAGYSLQAPAKTAEGRNHPDRDTQLQYLNNQINTLLAQGLPVVSVDANKRGLVGAFKTGGRAWPPQGHPEEVKVHDCPDPKLGKAIPYGIYDVGRKAGWVTVGQGHDTASVAVASLHHWWQAVGVHAYPQGDRGVATAIARACGR